LLCISQFFRPALPHTFASVKQSKTIRKMITKQKVQTGIILGMIFLSSIAFGQTTGPELEKANERKKTTKTYLDLMVNAVSTNLNYGGSNSALSDYKKSNNGIQAGVSFQAGITSFFSLVSELYFIRKGGKLNANNPLTNTESTLRLNTLELPMLARVHFGRFYVNVGPSIAYTLSGDRKTDEKSTKLSFNNTPEGFKHFEAGIQAGGGIEFPFKRKMIALDIRYNYGLTNIAYNREMHNRALMISVHFSKLWKTNPLGRS
jgi:hypothetical protein